MTAPLRLVDTSVINRLRKPTVRDAVAQPLRAGELAICAVVELEVLYSARSPNEYREVKRMLGGAFDSLPVTQQVCGRALEVQAELAEASQHRGAKLSDLLIAACAETHEVGLLHYDSDFDRIADVTKQPVEWVVSRGTAETRTER